MAVRAVKYGPQNCTITARVLTERYNKLVYLRELKIYLHSPTLFYILAHVSTAS